MRIPFILLIVSVLTNFLHAQLAIINDPDGFSNVREGLGSNTPVVDKIKDFEVFWIISDADSLSGWKDVAFYRTEDELPEEKLHKLKGKLFRKRLWLYGFIHQSRIQMLADLPKIPLVEKSDSLAIFADDQYQLRITVSRFDSSLHKINRDQASMLMIDGEIPYGTDGEIPGAEFSSIKIKTQKLSFEFPGEEFISLFLPSQRFWRPVVYRGRNGELYIVSHNSDGAGYYDLVWVFKDGKVLHRYVGSPY